MNQRIVFVSTGLNAGGAELALLRLSRRLTNMGMSCGVVSLGNEGAIGPELRRTSIPVWCLDLTRAAHWSSAVEQLRNALATVRPTVIQGWMYHGNIVATLAARRMTRKPALAWGVRQSLAAPSLDKVTTRLVIRLSALISQRADAIVYNSSIGREGHEAAGFSSTRSTVIPNGFEVDVVAPDSLTIQDVRRELQVPPDAPLIGHVARWHPVKDHQTLLSAAARVIKNYDQAVFVLVGDGVNDANRELSQKVAAHGMRRNVRLLGRRTDTARLQAAFDIACLTSLAESFPNVIGEAMCARVPCVSTAVGEVVQLIADTGRVVPAGDPEALGAALLDLISLKPEGLRQLGARARERIVEHYSLDSVAERYASLYEKLTATGAAKAV